MGAMKQVVPALLLLFSFQAYGQEPPSLYDLLIKAKKPKVKVHKTTKINFNTHHPQGMMKVGDSMFMTSVEVFKKPEKYTASNKPKDSAYDRDAGEGKGHFFQFDAAGNKIKDIPLGEGTIYHPGGFGYDGEYFWIPVAEYRPNSKSIVYKVKIDGDISTVEKAFEVNDHIGGITIGQGRQILQGISWGSRMFYKWGNTGKEIAKFENPSFYIDYQDCKTIDKNAMVCTGITKYDFAEEKVTLGGIDLISLNDFKILRQLPIVQAVPTDIKTSFTQNPTYFEALEGKIYMYSIPEDNNKSNLYVLELAQ
jgi:hypothetical protein